jgi:hypothetical protein
MGQNPNKLLRRLPPVTARWRRSHGPDIVAEIAAVDGEPPWRASVWRLSDATTVVRSQSWLEVRHSACAKADWLARTTFKHKCDLETCGKWVWWPEP